MNERTARTSLGVGALLQVALVVGAVIAALVSDVDTWSARLDGLFGIATVGQLLIVAVFLQAWPGSWTSLAKVGSSLVVLGLSVRLVASGVHLGTGSDPIILIVSTFLPTFLGLLLLGIAQVQVTGRADRRSWIPVAMAVIGFAVGNFHQINHRLDFTVSGFVWGVLWIVLAIATRSRVSTSRGATEERFGPIDAVPDLRR